MNSSNVCFKLFWFFPPLSSLKKVNARNTTLYKGKFGHQGRSQPPILCSPVSILNCNQRVRPPAPWAQAARHHLCLAPVLALQALSSSSPDTLQPLIPIALLPIPPTHRERDTHHTDTDTHSTPFARRNHSCPLNRQGSTQKLPPSLIFPNLSARLQPKAIRPVSG